MSPERPRRVNPQSHLDLRFAPSFTPGPSRHFPRSDRDEKTVTFPGLSPSAGDVAHSGDIARGYTRFSLGLSPFCLRNRTERRDVASYSALDPLAGQRFGGMPVELLNECASVRVPELVRHVLRR